MVRRGMYHDVTVSLIAGDPRLKVIDDIKAYSDLHASFKVDFLQHVLSCYERRGYVTDAHYSKLLNVYYGYFMDKKK